MHVPGSTLSLAEPSAWLLLVDGLLGRAHKLFRYGSVVKARRDLRVGIMYRFSDRIVTVLEGILVAATRSDSVGATVHSVAASTVYGRGSAWLT
jgi:hypothetical protein